MNPREFVEEYYIKSLVCCFSGGKDSLVTTHYTLSELENVDVNKYVVYVDTSVMLPGTTEFVKEVSSQYGWNVEVLMPEIDFWTWVGKKKMPMPSMHRRWCCAKLKLDPIKNFVKDLPPQRAEVTGLRRDENERRKNMPQHFFLKKSWVWKYAPIIDWTEKDVLRYMRKHDLPMPPNYRMGIKETCLCGAYSNKKQMEIVRGRFPEFFQKFVELEREFKSGGAAFYFQNKPQYAKDFLKQKTLDEKVA